MMDQPTASNAAHPSHSAFIPKARRRDLVIEQRKAKSLAQRRSRQERRKQGIRLEPHTIENMRVPDLTQLGAETDEFRRLASQDEFQSIYEGTRIPRLLITLSQRSKPKSHTFCRELAATIPNAQFMPRRKLSFTEHILPQAISLGFSAVLLFNEDAKRLNRLVVVHLPDGPTADFKLLAAKRRRDVHGNKGVTGKRQKLTPIEAVVPGLYLGRFQTAVGRRVGRILESLFPVPQCNAVTASPHNRLVTMFNMRDYVFFRSHLYELKEKIVRSDDGEVSVVKLVKRLALRELGPRFTLKVQSIRSGVFGRDLDQFEWTRDKQQQETSRRQFNL